MNNEFGKQGFLRTIIITILLCGLGAWVIAVGQRQEIRKEAAEDEGFTFTALGDTHAGIEEFPKFRGWADTNHRAAINKMVEINPDFYLHLGDMVQDPTNVAWNDFFSIEKPLMDKAPIYPTIGNHERYQKNKSYFDRFRENAPHLKSLIIDKNKPWYSFDWGNAHFISLWIDYDEWTPEGEACRPGSVQYQWLEDDLKSTDKPWKIVFFHVQIYSSTAETSTKRKEMRKYLHGLFKKYQVDVVFGGHDHYYERVEVDGITYIESGGGSGTRTPPAAIPERKKAADKTHIVKVIISGGSLTGTAISTPAVGKNYSDPGGKILDTFCLTKTIQPTVSPTPDLTPTPIPTPTPTSTPSPTPTALPGLYKGDLNSDGVINGLDWSIMKLKFGQSATLEEGDLNQDGQINGLDWSIMRMYYGQEG